MTPDQPPAVADVSGGRSTPDERCSDCGTELTADDWCSCCQKEPRPPVGDTTEPLDRVAKALHDFNMDCVGDPDWSDSPDSVRGFYRRMAQTAIAALPDVWIVHDYDGSVVSVHDSPALADHMLLGRERDWHIRKWKVRNG